MEGEVRDNISISLLSVMDVISPARVCNFGMYDVVFEHVHGVARVRERYYSPGAPMDQRPREEEMADAGNMDPGVLHPFRGLYLKKNRGGY